MLRIHNDGHPIIFPGRPFKWFAASTVRHLHLILNSQVKSVSFYPNFWSVSSHSFSCIQSVHSFLQGKYAKLATLWPFSRNAELKNLLHMFCRLWFCFYTEGCCFSSPAVRLFWIQFVYLSILIIFSRMLLLTKSLILSSKSNEEL